MLDKTLQMVFQNAAGKNITMSLAGVRDDVTPAEIKALMELVIAKNIFDSTGGNLVSLMSADIVSRDVQEIAVR